MNKITPFLWFNDQAEDAANFYVTLFPNSKITHVTPGQGGKASWVSFELDGREYYALNGGAYYTLTPAFSLFIHCDSQAEVDSYWEKLLDGGKASQCGWLTDKFGLSWQVIPNRLSELLGSPDKAAAGRVMQAMMQMVKIDIAGLEAAAAS